MMVPMFAEKNRVEYNKLRGYYRMGKDKEG